MKYSKGAKPDSLQNRRNRLNQLTRLELRKNLRNKPKKIAWGMIPQLILGVSYPCIPCDADVLLFRGRAGGMQIIAHSAKALERCAMLQVSQGCEPIDTPVFRLLAVQDSVHAPSRADILKIAYPCALQGIVIHHRSLHHRVAVPSAGHR